jgi:hypothetical protein
MKTMKMRALLALVALCLIVAAGCKTDQEGATNRVGTIKATLGASPAAVTEAAKEVLTDMDLIIISANSTAIDGRVVARTAQDVKVRVDSEKIGEDVSEVFIRVGTLGDSDLSLAVLTEIKKKLGIKVESAAPADKDREETKGA